jgi:D-arabinose 1-dehydrogenase-like Zn-dependent alcohol dehydrogenase
MFFLQLSVVGSTMGTRDELERLTRMLVTTGVRPVIHATMPLTEARPGFEAMVGEDVFGKVVFTI